MAKLQQRGIGFQNVQLFKAQSLGIGSYGAVCKAKCDDLSCAAKLLHPILFDPAVHSLATPQGEHRLPISRFEQECEFLSSIKHPNIIQYLGTHRDPENGLPVLLMELMDESLTSFLKQKIPYHIEVNISNDIAVALSFLHSNGIIHRDLSSNNVLMIGNSRAKVTDFGMAKLAGANPQASLTQTPGADVYMPPEATRIPPVYCEKIDCFSHGVLGVQIMTRQFPNPGDRLKMVEITDPKFPAGRVRVEIPEVERRQEHISLINQTHPLLPIALDCLKDEEGERPSAREICGRLVALKQALQFAQSVQEQATPQRSAADERAFKKLQQELEMQKQENQQLQQQLSEASKAPGSRHMNNLSDKHTTTTKPVTDVEYANIDKPRPSGQAPPQTGHVYANADETHRQKKVVPQGWTKQINPITNTPIYTNSRTGERWAQANDGAGSFYYYNLAKPALTVGELPEVVDDSRTTTNEGELYSLPDKRQSSRKDPPSLPAMYAMPDKRDSSRKKDPPQLPEMYAMPDKSKNKTVEYANIDKPRPSGQAPPQTGHVYANVDETHRQKDSRTTTNEGELYSLPDKRQSSRKDPPSLPDMYAMPDKSKNQTVEYANIDKPRPSPRAPPQTGHVYANVDETHRQKDSRTTTNEGELYSLPDKRYSSRKKDPPQLPDMYAMPDKSQNQTVMYANIGKPQPSGQLLYANIDGTEPKQDPKKTAGSDHEGDRLHSLYLRMRSRKKDPPKATAMPDKSKKSKNQEVAYANIDKPHPSGQAPPQTGQANVDGNQLQKVIVLYSYEPQGDQELTLQEGDIVTMVAIEDDVWWCGQLKGKVGMFPAAYVEPYEL